VATATVKLQDVASNFQDRTLPYINGHCQSAFFLLKRKHFLVATATVKLQGAASKFPDRKTSIYMDTAKLQVSVGIETFPYINGHCKSASSKWKQFLVATAHMAAVPANSANTSETR